MADRLGEIGPFQAAIALTARNSVKTRLSYLYNICIIYSKNSVYIYIQYIEYILYTLQSNI